MVWWSNSGLNFLLRTDQDPFIWLVRSLKRMDSNLGVSERSDPDPVFQISRIWIFSKESEPIPFFYRMRLHCSFSKRSDPLMEYTSQKVAICSIWTVCPCFVIRWILIWVWLFLNIFAVPFEAGSFRGLNPVLRSDQKLWEGVPWIWWLPRPRLPRRSGSSDGTGWSRISNYNQGYNG